MLSLKVYTQIGKKKRSQICRQTDRQINRQTDRKTDRKTDRQTDKQTDIKTDIKTDINRSMPIKILLKLKNMRIYFIKEIVWLSNTNSTLRELNRCNKKVK